ncbi:hypothetical protein CK501_13725 [Halovibrio salipaludis]|uniref:Uncharacterized protein n=1 Tax=Halovibrio salipaludis TaxID=2032626 RepID=A0A2A2F281_9GAMM|nr:aspartyl/asparaginyl beta-hydroxylase domain-containing protein [Halovibrio salipaludis]PAU78739.1 hypothetical protein CK501_13725 [Halovibrio salipaludis]
MPVAVTVFILIVAFVAGSMIYVYRFRGQERYKSVGEYWRKGWPIFSPLNCLLYLFTEKRARARELKKTNRRQYQMIKYSVNTLLALALCGVVLGGVMAIHEVAEAVV